MPPEVQSMFPAIFGHHLCAMPKLSSVQPGSPSPSIFLHRPLHEILVGTFPHRRSWVGGSNAHCHTLHSSKGLSDSDINLTAFLQWRTQLTGWQERGSLGGPRNPLPQCMSTRMHSPLLIGAASRPCHDDVPLKDTRTSRELIQGCK